MNITNVLLSVGIIDDIGHFLGNIYTPSLFLFTAIGMFMKILSIHNNRAFLYKKV